MTSRAWMMRTGTVAVAGLLAWLLFDQLRPREFPPTQAEALLQQAARLAARGDMSGAEALAREVIALDSGRDVAYRLAAECAVAQNRDEQALRDLSHITRVGTDEWLAARRMAASILHHRVHRLGQAERAYRDVLEVSPDDLFANEGYARLLGLCGRRTEAIPHVLRLLRAGQDTDLLMLLARESGALDDPQALAAARLADPTDPNPLLGLANAAALEQNPARSLDLLRQAAALPGLPDDFDGRLGRQLLANERFDELDEWASQSPDACESADCWFVRAQLAERDGDTRGAIRCYWEAVRLRPESLQTMNLLARALTTQNEDELAAVFHERVRQLNEFRDRQQRALMSSERPSFADVYAMIQSYVTVGRLWEAYAWGQAALEAAGDHAELRELLQSLTGRLPTLPLELTARADNPALQVDLSGYPLPSLAAPSDRPREGSLSGNIAFRQQRADVGFDFQYFDGTEGTTRRMFEFGGGGIGVVDFDADAAPDLFCTQGRFWETPHAKTGEHHDRLFRNLRGESFVDVSDRARLGSETGFGQGIAAGDLNNDGFADLYVANTGTNTLWLNNGDGTFSDISGELAGPGAQWTTSCLIADVNGDAFADLYDVNYLDGEDVFDRLCVEEHGDTIMCAPYDFEPARDRVWMSDGAGGYLDRTAEFLVPPPDGKGLGIAAVNLGDRRLSLFVANDTTANFFYTADGPLAQSLTDTALTAGVAFNGDGKAEACMGIAVGDGTLDGLLDLYVTNFLYESNTLYCQSGDGMFADRTQQLGLHAPTLPVLGFGTQFVDANLDGRLELFITNGFTQDLTKYDTPYQMRPQMFEWTGERFGELPAEQLGEWSRTPAVGRPAAWLDWNLDGRPDLVVGLLDAPSFLLTNASDAPENHSLMLQLIARESARDAIGTQVTATFGEAVRVSQLTAGDGYQCSNQRRILIGCGTAPRIDRLRIDWPSGSRQEFDDVDVSQPLLLVEGGQLLPASG